MMTMQLIDTQCINTIRTLSRDTVQATNSGYSGTAVAGHPSSLASILRAHVNRLEAGEFFALLAYVQMNDAHGVWLQAIHHAVRDKKRVATCLGFGPRFLHSTGQAYKGGLNRGVFLQITGQDPADLPVPRQRYTFGIVKAAQARRRLSCLGRTRPTGVANASGPRRAGGTGDPAGDHGASIGMSTQIRTLSASGSLVLPRWETATR